MSYLRESDVEVIGFLDDNPDLAGRIIRGISVLGSVALLDNLHESHGVDAVYCPLGNNRLRVDFLNKARALGYVTPNYIHPSVILSPHVEIGQGVYILLGTTIMPYTIIKDDVMISMGVHVAHHNTLAEGVFLSTGCNFGASITAGKYAYCGISSTIVTGIHTLGEDCLVGAGAVVVSDVPACAVVAGVPAKILKYKQIVVGQRVPPPPPAASLQIVVPDNDSFVDVLTKKILLTGSTLSYSLFCYIQSIQEIGNLKVA